MIIRQLKITNNRGDSINFGRHFRIANDFKLSGLLATVNYSTSTSDGSHYQNTKLDNRDYDIPFFIHRKGNGTEWIEEKRAEAYRVFNPTTNPMRIDFATKSGRAYYLDANLEGSPTFLQGFENDNHEWLRGLLQFSSGDPYIYESDSKAIDIALWQPSFEFPLEIPVEGIEMGYRARSLIANVFNDGQDETGMNIRFRALGSLSNPSLLNVNTYELLRLNMDLEGGDVVDISTYKGRRSITLTRMNAETNVFNRLDFQNSTFLQLSVGDNLFRYDADEGIDNLEVSMTYTPIRIGV